MFKILGKNKKKVEKVDTTINKTNTLSLKYGDVLRVVLRDGEQREVTIISVHENGMRVKELFHGIYDLSYNEIMLAYQNNVLYTLADIKKCALCADVHYTVELIRNYVKFLIL